MHELEKQMKALANRRRLSILKYLKKVKHASVGDISLAIKLSFKSTSNHLTVLYAAAILEKEQKSLTVIYSIPKILHKATQGVINTL